MCHLLFVMVSRGDSESSGVAGQRVTQTFTFQHGKCGANADNACSSFSDYYDMTRSIKYKKKGFETQTI